MSKAQCPEKHIGYIFYYSRTSFSNISPYLEKVKKIDDPILQHITLYLIENYNNAKTYFEKSNPLNVACDALNRWLDQMQHLFTSGKECTKNNELWEKSIKEIWNELSSRNGELCERKSKIGFVLPDELKPINCNQHIPEKYNCTDHSNLIPSICNINCPPCIDKTSPNSCPTVQLPRTLSHEQIQTSCDSGRSTPTIISISVGSTIFVTIFLQFFLYKFTNFGSWLYKSNVNKGMPRQHFIEEETYDEFEGSSEYTNVNFDMERNHLLYHSMRN
ncbi:hypothetical protein POWCR01_000093100 [Plasmodium ovale]|uniref:PIR protein n=1 Tax=Plasmodium ovale TaxID=36330 RepID=A0A1C3KHJ4_PLAOA|nr:hypothetical protein POWCR01_000093100 [Plasmodium ovale]